ncbi:MAG: arylsulfatase [Pseudomonadota bacterium]
MRCSIVLAGAWVLAAGAAAAQAPDARPNILVVLFDDAGYMDFGGYGSDTRTPNIDALTAEGAQFARYYSTPLCGPSRAALMTGLDNHSVGAGTLAEVLTTEMRALPAYSMTWPDDQVTVASQLQAAGYQTFVTGKWGIGDIGANLPHRFGFDRSWVMDATGASNYAAKSYLPLYTEVKWFEDGERVALPEDFYSSRNIVDKMIDYVDRADPNKPFFGFVSFLAVHLPVQAPIEYIDGYNGVFDRGWDVMRAERLERAIELGLVAETAKLAPPPESSRAWETLSADEKAFWARSMQVNAGMMEAADFHLGRLLEHLEAKGALDNTIVIVTSDNGPEYNTIGLTSPPALRAFERAWMTYEGWDTDYENLGLPGSMAAIGQEWASVSAAPFHLFKFSAAEGGVRVPLVIAGPEVAPVGLVTGRAQVVDIAPTLLDLAGVPYDADAFRGRSLTPVLSGKTDSVYSDSDPFAIEVSGTAALYRGNWKLTKTPDPFGDGQWHLYDIVADPGETTDLAAAEPALMQDMIAEYESYADEVGVFELAPGESGRKQLTINALKKTAQNYWYLLAVGMGVMAVIAVGVIGLLRRLFRRRAVS